MLTELQKKYSFLPCSLPGQEDKTFLLQTTGPQYLFQVLCFTSDDQYQEYKSAAMGAFSKLQGYRIAAQLVGNLQYISINQDNSKEVVADIKEVEKEAVLFYKQNFNIEQFKE